MSQLGRQFEARMEELYRRERPKPCRGTYLCDCERCANCLPEYAPDSVAFKSQAAWRPRLTLYEKACIAIYLSAGVALVVGIGRVLVKFGSE